MTNQEPLTNEALKSHFKDNFGLAQFAIEAARFLVKSGQEVDVPTLLKEIQKNPQLFKPEQLSALEKADEEESQY